MHKNLHPSAHSNSIMWQGTPVEWVPDELPPIRLDVVLRLRNNTFNKKELEQIDHDLTQEEKIPTAGEKDEGVGSDVFNFTYEQMVEKTYEQMVEKAKVDKNADEEPLDLDLKYGAVTEFLIMQDEKTRKVKFPKVRKVSRARRTPYSKKRKDKKEEKGGSKPAITQSLQAEFDSLSLTNAKN